MQKGMIFKKNKPLICIFNPLDQEFLFMVAGVTASPSSLSASHYDRNSLSVLCTLPVCRCRAWTCVLCSLVSSCRETPGVVGHRATGTPGGSRPAPSAPHILGGLGLRYSDMKHSEKHTQTVIVIVKGKHKYTPS